MEINLQLADNADRIINGIKFQSKEMEIALQVKQLLLQHDLTIDEAAKVCDHLNNRILWAAKNKSIREGHNNFT